MKRRNVPTVSCILRRVYVPLYGQWLTILVADNYRRAWQMLLPDTNYTPGAHANGSAYFNLDTGNGCIALRTDATAGTVAHEATHYVNALMHYVGIKHDVDNQEPHAYLIGWVVDTLENVRRKSPRKEKAVTL